MPSWGGDSDEEEFQAGRVVNSEVDKDGKRTRTEYKVKEDGSRVKIVTTYKVTTTETKMKSAVARRAKLARFGAASAAYHGSVEKMQREQTGVSTVDDELELNLLVKKKEKKTEAAPEKQKSMVVCRTCGMEGDHFTLRCPFKDRMGAGENPTLGDGGKAGAAATAAAGAAAMKSEGPPARGGGSSLAELAAGGGKSGSYRPPALRGEGTARDASDTGEGPRRDRDERPTLRVTNLAEEVTEQDLQDLFRPFGPISRLYLAKDHNTGLSKGFAFVSYYEQMDAANAMKRLAGVGFNHLIINVDWARPSNK